MAEAQDKGNALEEAVRAIEEHILRSFPGYNDKTFKIEWKKRLDVNGAKPEIDVWVEVDLGFGHSSRIIFECKNREEKVSVSDVIVLKEKIDLARAHHGYLVGRHFTKDARALAATYLTVTVLEATDLLIPEMQGKPGGMVVRDYEVEQYHLRSIDVRGQTLLNEFRKIDIRTAVAEIDGRTLPFMAYFDEWKEDLWQRFDMGFSLQHRGVGTYDMNHYETRRFDGRLRVNSIPVAAISIRGEFRIHIHLPEVTSHFDIETRGRAITFAQVNTSRMMVRSAVTMLATANQPE